MDVSENFNTTLARAWHILSLSRVVIVSVINRAKKNKKNKNRSYRFHRNSNVAEPAGHIYDAQLSHKNVQKRKRFSRVRNFSILYGPSIAALMTFARTFSPSHFYRFVFANIGKSDYSVQNRSPDLSVAALIAWFVYSNRNVNTVLEKY